MSQPKMFDLQVWERGSNGYRLSATPIFNSPYSVCKAKKTTIEANTKGYFAFLKIVPNEK